MTPDVISATPDTPVSELIRLMLDNRISAVPIVADGAIVGIVSEGDLLRRAETGTERRPSRWLELVTSDSRLAADYTKTHGRKAAEVMTREVVTVADTTPIAEVAKLLETRRIKRVPVVRGGRLVGIVSRRNLLQALGSRLAPNLQPWMTEPSATPSMRSSADRRGLTGQVPSMPLYWTV
jgi:CBS domain-containing protein